MKLPDIRGILAIPAAYSLLSRIIGGKDRYVAEFVRAKSGDRILDVGCGLAEILRHLPEVE